VLPLLPIIVGGGVGGGKSLRRAITVTVSLAVSVILFTLLIKAGTLLIAVPPQFWKGFSGGIIIAIGLISLFPSVWEKLPYLSKLSIGSNQVLAFGYKKQNIWGDVIVGASLGPVFSTCSPTYFLVLATVLPENFVLGIIYLIAYSVGLSLSLFLVAFVGQRILNKVRIVADPQGKFKKILGIIFILVGITIITGAAKTLQVKLLDFGFFDITKIEQKLLEFVSF
jgi:cytochrome c biogenesis protein CcdA